MINARMAKRIRDRGLVPVIDHPSPSEYTSITLKGLCHRVKELLDELNAVDIAIGELAAQEEQSHE